MPPITVLLKNPALFNFLTLYQHPNIKAEARQDFETAFMRYVFEPTKKHQLDAAMSLRQIVFESIPEDMRPLYANLENDVDYDEEKHFTPLITTSTDVPASLVSYFADMAKWPIKFITSAFTQNYGNNEDLAASIYGLSKSPDKPMGHFSIGPLYPITTPDGNCFFHSVLQIARSAYLQIQMEEALSQQTLLLTPNTTEPFQWLKEIAETLNIKLALYILGPNDFKDGALEPQPTIWGNSEAAHSISLIGLAGFPGQPGQPLNLNGIAIEPNCLYSVDGQFKMPIEDPVAFRHASLELLRYTNVPIFDTDSSKIPESIFGTPNDLRIPTMVPGQGR